MNCRDVRSQLDDWLDGELPAAQGGQMKAHVQRCAACASAAAERRALTEALRTLPVPPPSPGFAERTLAQAIQRPRVRPRTSLAVAAGLVVGIAVGALWGLPQPPLEQGLPGVMVSVAEPRNVSLVFESTQALEAVTFTVRLPEGVELAGYPEQRALSWVTDLDRGKNQLTLPLLVRSGLGGEVVAELEHGGQRRLFNLRVTARSPEGAARATPEGSNLTTTARRGR